MTRHYGGDPRPPVPQPAWLVNMVTGEVEDAERHGAALVAARRNVDMGHSRWAVAPTEAERERLLAVWRESLGPYAP